jgi:hypothetical protein
MSDVSQGPGWWTASDGKWYPPELHPSVQSQTPVAATTGVSGHAGTGGSQHQSHVGPQFPNMFEAALHGSPMADAVSVIETDAHNQRTVPSRGYGDTFIGTPIAGASKKRRRRGH